jgi:dinuclear metal center YbgI/SA1388 family protein
MNTTSLQHVCDFLEHFAPLHLAEEWDNVGLLVGDRNLTIDRIMTCLTVTPASAAEAIETGAQLIVAHHPLPFHPLKRVTTDTTAGKMLWDLIGAGIAIYSPHTAFDSAGAGINQALIEGLGVVEAEPLIAADEDSTGLGSGRFGKLAGPILLRELAERVKSFLKVEGLRIVGKDDSPVSTIAVACGAAGTFLAPAQKMGCDVLVTGETNFHTCLEAESTEIGLLLPGHFASERFAVEQLAERMGAEFQELEVWASRQEAAPYRWV